MADRVQVSFFLIYDIYNVIGRKDKKMLTRVSSILVALALIGLISGCSKAPVTELDESETALKDAGQADAQDYVPQLYKQASDSLNAAKVEMQNQDSKFSMFRNYDRTKELLSASKNLASQAQEKAALEKERIRQLDSVLISELETMIAQTKTALAKAPRGKGTKVDLEMMKADLTSAEGALTGATEDFRTGAYMTAKSKLEAAKAQVSAVKGQIDTATAALRKK
jgi:hypothetical protein